MSEKIFFKKLFWLYKMYIFLKIKIKTGPMDPKTQGPVQRKSSETTKNSMGPCPNATYKIKNWPNRPKNVLGLVY